MDRRPQNTPGARKRASTKREARIAFRKRLRDDKNAAVALDRLVDLGIPRKALVELLFEAGAILFRRAALQAKQPSFREAVGLPDTRAASRLVKKLRSLAKQMEPVDTATHPPSDEEMERRVNSLIRKAEAESKRTGKDVIGCFHSLLDADARDPGGLTWVGSDEEFETDLSVPASRCLRAKAAHLRSVVYSYQKHPRPAIGNFVEEQVVLFVRSHATARQARDHFQATCDLLDWLYRLPRLGKYQVNREALSRRTRRLEARRLRKGPSLIR